MNEGRAPKAMPGAVVDGRRLPRHLAISADGNGRWATARGLPRSEGHRQGGEAFLRLLEDVAGVGIEYLSFYALSTENLTRPTAELEYLYDLYEQLLPRLAVICRQHDIRMRHLGSRSALPTRVQEALRQAESATSGGRSVQLQMCIAYGGRNEITDASRAMVAAAMAGQLNPEEIDSTIFAGYLYVEDIPDIDLLVRTSGENRLSNFMIWQAAYAELLFTPTLWPDYTATELMAGLETFAGRRRRFGQTS